ncbi:MAG: hypothetical protein ACRD3T_04455 [Terriglobia bacterium]
MINRRRAGPGEPWQARFFDSALRTVKEYNKKASHVHFKAVSAGLVRCPQSGDGGRSAEQESVGGSRMGRDIRPDHNRWRDEFERTGQNPIAWQLQARSHLGAANVLLQRAQSLPQGRGGEVSEDHDPPHLRMMPVYLLYGYALENLAKGLLVARGETATWSGSLDESRSASLDRGLKHHCLNELFRVAAVKTNAQESRLLDDLRDAIESEKYPVGVRPRYRKRTLGADPVGNVQRVFALFRRMEQSLHQICLDGVLSPCDPPTLGVAKK